MTPVIRDLVSRADDLVKAAPNRPDPEVARRQAAELLEQARAHLDDIADAEERFRVATEIARRMGEIDAAELARIEPAPGMRRAPTDATPDRVPPGQRLVPGWPVLHVGAMPDTDAEDWTLTVTGLVGARTRLTHDDLRALPTITDTSDFHCVTHWSRLDCQWEGVRVRDVLDAAGGARPEATHALVTGHPAYAANLALDVLLTADVLFAWGVDGQPLPRQHGGPLRLVVPSRYGWKSVKWAFELRLTDRDVPGYWEERGYHMNADPFLEQRFRGD